MFVNEYVMTRKRYDKWQLQNSGSFPSFTYIV